MSILHEVDNLLNEMSLSRIYRHAIGSTGRPIGFITAFRIFKGKDKDGNPIPWTLKENREKNDVLEGLIKHAGYGYVKVKGGYIEGFNTSTARDVEDESFMIIGAPNDTQELLNFLKKEGEEYNQDSILYISLKKKAVLVGTSDYDELGKKIKFPGYKNVIELGDFHTGENLGQFYTKWKGRKFVFKEVDETFKFGESSGIFGKWAKSIMDKKERKKGIIK
jgi:hypothetical protein